MVISHLEATSLSTKIGKGWACSRPSVVCNFNFLSSVLKNVFIANSQLWIFFYNLNVPTLLELGSLTAVIQQTIYHILVPQGKCHPNNREHIITIHCCDLDTIVYMVHCSYMPMCSTMQSFPCCIAFLERHIFPMCPLLVQ